MGGRVVADDIPMVIGEINACATTTSNYAIGASGVWDVVTLAIDVEIERGLVLSHSRPR